MKLLLVDDSLTQRLGLKNVLLAAGYSDIRLAGSAREAFEILGMQDGRSPQAPAGDVDLILMDLRMPGIDGIEACRRIKALPALQDIPIIMVTASEEASDLAQAFVAGAMDYITKPPNELELHARVRSALRLKAEMDSRKAREQELDAERGRLSALIEASRDGIVLVDHSGVLRVINPAAMQLMSLAGGSGRWVGRPVTALLHALAGRAPAAVRAALAEARRTQDTPAEGECAIGAYALHWIDLPVQTGSQTLGRLTILHNVTEERHLARMREELVHTMVHDLRNPLTSISVAMQLFKLRYAESLSDEQARLATMTLGAAGHMLELVNAILDVSRLEAGQLPMQCEAVDLAVLVGDVFQLQQPLVLEKRQSLTCEIAAQVPRANADPALIRRVLQNLVGNAVKFTPAGGSIRVRVQAPGGRGSGAQVLVCVEDTGPGIPAELQGRLFQSFVTGDHEARGSGLGLAFYRLVVEAHGGRTWVESEPGKGTRMFFVLPVVVDKSPLPG